MMQQTYILSGLNREALDAQLSVVLSAHYGGFSSRETKEGISVTVNLTGATSQAEIDQLNSLMAAYDPSVLTSGQQAEQQRQQKLASLRSANDNVLDPADYSSKDTLTKAMAQKLAWLEQEILELRGGRA